MIHGESGGLFEKVVVSTTPVGFTTTQVDGRSATRAVCTLDGGDVRIRYDGPGPTATTGLYLIDKDVFIIEGIDNVRRFKAIRAGAVNVNLNGILES